MEVDPLEPVILPPTPSPIQQDEENDSPPTNPMVVSLVAEVLFPFIPKDASTLKKFRLVCKSWRDWSQDTWNHLYGTLTLYPPNIDTHHPHFDQSNTEIPSLKLYQFCRQYSDHKDNLFKYPFQKYDLRLWKLHPNFTQGLVSRNLDCWFWKTCGPIIKHLTLQNCNSFGTFTIFSEQFLRALPNLTSLKVLGGVLLSPEAFKVVHQQYLHKVGFFEHLNLKSLHLEVMLPEQQLKEMWAVFQKSLPHLEHLKIRRLCGGKGPDQFELSDFTNMAIGRSLKTLDIVEYTSSNLEHQLFQNLPLQNPLGISAFPDVFQVFSVSRQKNEDTSGGGGSSLDVFVCPLVEPLIEVPFPSIWNLENVVELRLWGSICSDLWFLSRFRNLRILSVKTSCWEDRGHRGKVLRYLREGRGEEWRGRNHLGGGTRVEMKGSKVVVCQDQDQGASETVWVMPSYLQRLEVDWRWGRNGLRGLAKVVRGLREFKGVVRGDKQLREVRKIWGRGLERLELGHGSGGFSREGIMEVVVEGMGRLKEFRWRGCSCLREEVGEGDWRGVEEGLRGKFGEGGYTVPWGMEGGGDLEGVCLVNKFDKGVKRGWVDERLVDRMLAV